MQKFIFVLIIILLIVWRVRKGFQNGMMKEIVTILSGIASLGCVALILFAISSALLQATNTLIACIVALIVLGVIFKLCNLIFTPLLAIGNISVIGGFNKFLGAALGFAEGCAIAYLLYKILEYFGIHII